MIIREFKETDLINFEPNNHLDYDMDNIMMGCSYTVLKNDKPIIIFTSAEIHNEGGRVVGMVCSKDMLPIDLRYLKKFIKEQFKRENLVMLMTFSKDNDTINREHEFLGFSRSGHIKHFKGLNDNYNLWTYYGG